MSNPVVTIPLSKLVSSPANVRKVAVNHGLDELAASIEAHGLLQNLTVRFSSSGKKSDGKYEVVAGSRRLAALRQLLKQKRIRKNFPVTCCVLKDADGADVEISLAENVVRTVLHPADQFDAFHALHAKGLGAPDIAARFGISEAVVLQRLKLAAVSPRLLDLYRKGEMTLDQLMVFSISDDHAAQEAAWFDKPHNDRSPRSIRSLLTKALVEGIDRRARFIGVAAYKAAGGTIIRDLFQPDAEGYFTDSQLLDRLVAEKLKEESEKIRKEGWSWVEVLPEQDFAYLSRFGRIPPTEGQLSAKDGKRLKKVCEHYDSIIVDLPDEPSLAVNREIERLEAEMASLTAKRERWSKDDKDRSGAHITLDAEGRVVVVRGLLRRDDRSHDDKKRASQSGEPQGRPSKRQGGLSDGLLVDLSAQRTAALRALLAESPEIALQALLHTLILKTFFASDAETCLSIHAESADLRRYADGIGESRATEALSKAHRHCLDRLPDQVDLWSWLGVQDLDTRLALLAYCTSVTINAVQARHGSEADSRLEHANALATTLNLDMADWWEPTPERYLDHVSKDLILAAVREAASPQAAENIARMKKPAMIARAGELLAGKRWLPEPLRTRAQGHETK